MTKRLGLQRLEVRLGSFAYRLWLHIAPQTSIVMRRLPFFPKKELVELLVIPNSLTYLELFQRAKKSNSAIWTTPSMHQWYQGRPPGGVLSLQCIRHE
ncbi:hypothetical protein TNCV_4509531 [Trichonephila clavipes]|nr:hypothetical protein TNCV_4509531 [Trichonephila clavipes]